MLNNSKDARNVTADWCILSGTTSIAHAQHGQERDGGQGRLNSVVFVRNRSSDVLQVDEAALKVLLQSRSIRQFKLIEAEGGYDVFLELTTGEGCMLVTSRASNKPRRRANVDAFVKWLRKQTPHRPPILISFSS